MKWLMQKNSNNHIHKLAPALKLALHRIDCPSTDDLMLYVWEMLDSTPAAEIKQHLQQCRACADEVAVFAKPVRSATPQLPVSQHLNAIKDQIRVMIAQLVSIPESALMPLKGEAALTQYFEITEKNWQVMITPSKDAFGYALSGQIIADEVNFSALQVHLVLDNTKTAALTPDVVGWFQFNAVKHEWVDMLIEGANERIELHKIRVFDSS